MLPFRHILLPVDFSERSLGMVRCATAFASYYRSRLSLLHVADNPLGIPLVPDAPGPIALDSPLREIESLEQYLREFAQAEAAGPCVTRRVLRGDPATEILRYINDQKVDLVAMPTHGYGVFRRFLLGSVTAKVLHDAPVPVLTGAHFPNVPELDDAPTFRRILCAVDLGGHSEATLRFAARLADDLHSELALMHVVAVNDPSLALNFGADWECDLVRHAKDALHDLQREVAAPGDIFVKIGEAGQQIGHLASAIHADLAVIGRSVDDGSLGGRLRASAYSVIRQSPCPVISV